MDIFCNHTMDRNNLQINSSYGFCDFLPLCFISLKPTSKCVSMCSRCVCSLRCTVKSLWRWIRASTLAFPPSEAPFARTHTPRITDTLSATTLSTAKSPIGTQQERQSVCIWHHVQRQFGQSSVKSQAVRWSPSGARFWSQSRQQPHHPVVRGV